MTLVYVVKHYTHVAMSVTVRFPQGSPSLGCGEEVVSFPAGEVQNLGRSSAISTNSHRVILSASFSGTGRSPSPTYIPADSLPAPLPGSTLLSRPLLASVAGVFMTDEVPLSVCMAVTADGSVGTVFMQDVKSDPAEPMSGSAPKEPFEGITPSGGGT